VFTVPWLRWSVTGLSPRSIAFDPRSVHVRFVMDKGSLWQVSFPLLRISPVSIIPPMLRTHLLLHVCFYQKGNGRSLGTPTSNAVSEIAEHCIDRYFSSFFKGLIKVWSRYKTTLHLYSSVTIVTTLRARRLEVPFPAETDCSVVWQLKDTPSRIHVVPAALFLKDKAAGTRN